MHCGVDSPCKATAKECPEHQIIIIYPNRVLLISSSSSTHELYRIKMKEVEAKISHAPGLFNSLICIICESRRNEEGEHLSHDLKCE